MALTLKKTQQIGAVVKKVLGEIETKSSRPEMRVFCRWTDIVGAKISIHAQPARFCSGRLIIGVDSPAWIQQLSFLKEEIKGKIKNQTGLEVKEIIFKIK